MSDHLVEIRPIGIIHSPYRSREEAPYQGCDSDKTCDIELFNGYEDGLKDIEGFSHLIVLYLLHESKGYSLLVKTPHDSAPHGVFATRSPDRPNPLGLSVVSLVAREGNILRVGELDAIDGTPVLDIKPYIPAIDQKSDVRIGWLEGKPRLRRHQPSG